MAALPEIMGCLEAAYPNAAGSRVQPRRAKIRQRKLPLETEVHKCGDEAVRSERKRLSGALPPHFLSTRLALHRTKKIDHEGTKDTKEMLGNCRCTIVGPALLGVLGALVVDFFDFALPGPPEAGGSGVAPSQRLS